MIERAKNVGITALSKAADRPQAAQALRGLIESLNLEIAGEENLDLTAEHVKAGGTVLAVFNHIALVDPLIVWRILNEKSMEKPVFPTSMKFKDGRMQVLSSIVKHAEKAFGFEIRFMIQGGDTDYSRSDQVLSTLGGLYRMAEVLTTRGGVGVFAPEGTRSRKARMNRAKSAFTEIYEYGDVSQMVLTLPVGLAGTERIHRVGSWRVNPFATAQVIVGRPLTYDELLEDRILFDNPKMPVEDLIMVRIAALVPERYGGYYEKKYSSEIRSLRQK